jgi:hypothetical protein
MSVNERYVGAVIVHRLLSNDFLPPVVWLMFGLVKAASVMGVSQGVPALQMRMLL